MLINAPAVGKAAQSGGVCNHSEYTVQSFQALSALNYSPTTIQAILKKEKK